MPGVYVTTTEFLDDAKSAARDRGMPGIRMIALPADKYYRARASKQEAEPIASAVINQLIDDEVRPLTAAEATPARAQQKLEAANIKVTGDDYQDAAEKVNELFLDNHWADGMPIIPPTPKLVHAMLAGTTRSPQEVLGRTAPKQGIATVEKIAINAVMAGAKPEYFPVILAAMDGFLDKHYDLTHVQASTGSFTPVVVVDGPIAQELGFNSGIGMLGHGWRANSTVGRALRLSLLNTGQTWPQVNDIALTGRLEAYTFFTFAEDTAKSPWEPYNVSRGYKPEDSTVTVASSGNPVVLGGGAVAPWTGQGILDQIVTRIKSGGVVWPHSQTYILVLHPDCAVDLADHGYTRRSLQEYLYEQTRVPYEKISGPVLFGHDDEVDFIRASIAMVAGGSPGYDLLFSYPGTNWANQTKKVTGATLTNAGR